MWVEEDYCSPPLAMEREACKTGISMNFSRRVGSEEDGWKSLDDKALLWSQ